MWKKFVQFSAASFLFASLTCHAETFYFEVTSPNFRVTIPNIPQMEMKPHLLQRDEKQPHLRYLGYDDGPHVISILTPTADAGMTAIECASSIMRSLATRPGVAPSSKIYSARINDRTFVAIYAMPHGNSVQLHAHFLSAAGGTHCIEVHVSKFPTTQADVAPWFKGFGKANIEPF